MQSNDLFQGAAVDVEFLEEFIVLEHPIVFTFIALNSPVELSSRPQTFPIELDWVPGTCPGPY